MTTAAAMEWRAKALRTGRQSTSGPGRGLLPLGLGCRRLHQMEPLDVLREPTPARGVNALLTRACVAFTAALTEFVPDPGEPLLARFNATVDEYKHDIAEMIEGLGGAYWGLPDSRPRARLVSMWERNRAAASMTCPSASQIGQQPARSDSLCVDIKVVQMGIGTPRLSRSTALVHSSCTSAARTFE